MIPNPDYVYDEKMHSVCTDGCTHIGFELWQVKTGTLFVDIIITNSLEEAQKFAEETFFKKKDDEANMLDEKKEAEREEQKESGSKYCSIHIAWLCFHDAFFSCLWIVVCVGYCCFLPSLTPLFRHSHRLLMTTMTMMIIWMKS